MSLFNELKRRNVIRVAIAYLVIAWVIVQVIGVLSPMFDVSASVQRGVVLFLAVGFLPAMFFAWAFEITPEGIKKEKEVSRDESITNLTAKKLDMVTIGLLVVAIGLFGLDRFSPREIQTAVPATQTEIETTLPTERITNVLSEVVQAISDKSIAVLPFANRSNLDDDLFFADGIHDDLLTQLAKISDMKVISRTSVMQYRDTEKAIPQIAEELGVATVLEGGVQRAGKRIRINAQLIDVATDEHLWAETFDREMTIDNLFDIQSEITKHIVAAVKGQLTPEEKNILEDKPTNSLAAWEAYSKAREIFAKSDYNADTFRAIQPLVEEAIRYDPNFVQALTLLMEVHGQAYWLSYDLSKERQQAAKVALDKVIALAPNTPGVLAAQSKYLYRLKQDYVGSLDLILRAIAAKPGDAGFYHHLGNTQRRLGLWDESVASFLQAGQLDPGTVYGQFSALETLTHMRDAARVKKLLPAAQERFPDSTDLGSLAALLAVWADGDVATARKVYDGLTPDTGYQYFTIGTRLPWYENNFEAVIADWQRPERQAYQVNYIGALGMRELDLATAYQMMGQQDLATTQLAKVLELLTPIDYTGRKAKVADHLITLAKAYALKGESEQSVKLANEAIELFPIAMDKVDGPDLKLAAVHALALAGERDKALKMIAELLEIPGLTSSRWQLYLDPRWDFFRGDERFNKLIKPLNFDESVHAKKKDIK